MRRGAYGAVLAVAFASVVFAASAAAGNPHGSPAGVHVSGHAGAHATVTAHAHGNAHATSSGGAAGVHTVVGVRAHGQAHGNAGVRAGAIAGTHAVTTTHTNGHANAVLHSGLDTHAKAHVQTTGSVAANLRAGVKPSATTGFNALVSASSNRTKLYGNGMTAGQIALLAGMGSAMLLGPGNSQAHLVLCGNRLFEVHALKAHLGACGNTVGVTTGTFTPTGAGAAVGFGVSPTQTSLSPGLQGGLKPSATTGFNALVSASSNQTKLYGNGMTAGQIALQAGTGGVMLFGPGNSQAHLVLCGNRVVDVHALKAHAGACTTGVTLGTTSVVLSSSTPSIAAVTAQSSAALGANTSAATTRANVATKAKGRAGGVLGATATQAKSKATGAVLGATAHRGTLPFTGLALALPIGLALMLLVSGLGIRRAARSQNE